MSGFPRIIILIAAGFTAGCVFKKPVKVELTPAEAARASKTPVVDVHTHSFNALYLPLQQIARGKRDIAPPLSWLVTDELADGLTGSLAAATARRQGKIAIATNDAALDQKVLEYSSKPDTRTSAELDAVLSWRQKLMLGSLANGFSPHAGVTGPPDDMLRHFISCLTRKDTDLHSTLILDHKYDETRNLQLVLSHTMDLAPVYDQKAKDSVLLDFHKQQIPRMQEQVRSANGSMAYFVAYCPYRDHWHGDEDAHPGHSLEIAQDAVRSRGAYGIKFYPPSGYRPICNEILPRPRTLFASEPGLQWEARYAGLTGAELDARCLKLFQWCIHEDLPVFAHCGPGEFQARKGYGAHHGDPIYWQYLLQSSRSMGKLRLCLGHAGGEDFWLGAGDFIGWGERVYELCTQYPNVYCEFGIHGEIVSDKARAKFVTKVLECIKKSRRDRTPYDFAKKIMYGSDWFMPMPNMNGRENYLRGFQQAALTIEQRLGGKPGFFDDFMYRNSLRYLNATKRQSDPRLAPALRTNLARLTTRSRQ
jgi:hypothetical protein